MKPMKSSTLTQNFTLLILLYFFSVSLFAETSENRAKTSEFLLASGFVVIKSKPSGAEVFIGGKSTGKETPFQMQLDEGTYHFVLKLPMYRDFKIDVTIVEGQTLTKEVILRPAYGSINVTSEPSGALITLDGISTNQKTPYTLDKILSGVHSISLSRDMYSNASQQVEVKDEELSKVFLDLQAGYGTVGIVAKPDAIISLDGNVEGSGNYSGRLPPGKHKILVSREKYYSQQQEITVLKGQEEVLIIQLVPILGSLTVMVDPPETAIYLNSKYYGLSPKSIDSLIIGEYNLELKKEGFAIFRKHIVIEENKTVQINNALQSGKLIKVKSTPDSAEVYYNGSVVGTTPAEFVVKDGSNKLILKKKYFVTKEVFVTAERNEQDFNFRLEVDRQNVNISFETIPSKSEINIDERTFLPESSAVSAMNMRHIFIKSPCKVQIPIGKYDLTLEKKGFNSIKKEVMIEKEENFKFNLEPKKYRTKGNALLLSILWPGAGQSYLNRGSVHFLMGFVGYGSIAYSIYQHSEAVKNYDLYLAEENPQKRVSLKSEWQKNLDLSHYSMYAGAAVWGINLIWTLATQSEVKKYKNVQFSLLNTSTGPIPTFGWRSNF